MITLICNYNIVAHERLAGCEVGISPAGRMNTVKHDGNDLFPESPVKLI